MSDNSSHGGTHDEEKSISIKQYEAVACAVTVFFLRRFETDSNHRQDTKNHFKRYARIRAGCFLQHRGKTYVI